MGANSQEARGLARGIVGAARVTAFGTSIVAPAASVITVLVIVVSYAGFASPLVVLITFAGSMCCALSISEFARRVPSAGWAYTYNSRGLGQTAGFLTGWMMIFGYALFVPAGIALTSTYASRLLADDVFHATVSPSALFVVIVAAVALITYLGIGTSASVDLLLVAGEMAVIAALAITILAKAGPAHYSLAVFSPASSPHGQLTDITNAMIYGITAFAGFEAAAALGEEARDTRRSVPASIIGIVVVTGIFYLLVILAETFDAGRRGIPRLIAQPSPLGDLTSRYWSPSALWIIDLVVVLTGLGFVIAASNAAIRILFAMAREQALPAPLTRLSRRHTPVVAIACLAVLTLLLGLPLTYAYGGARTAGYLLAAGGLAVVLVYLAGNIAVIRAFRTEFRDEYSFWRHLLIPATAVAIFLFPLWGILRPPAYTLVNLLPFTALGWLCLGLIAAAVLRARRPASFQALGRVFMPAEEETSTSKDLGAGQGGTVSGSAGRRRRRSAWTARARHYRDKLRDYQDRLEQRPQIAFLLQANRRFKKIEGKHLALVISVNLFVAVIPLLIIIYAFAEAFSANRSFGALVARDLHLTGSSALIVRDTFTSASSGKSVALSISLISLLITGLDVSATAQLAYARAFSMTPLRGVQKYLRGAGWLVLLLAFTVAALGLRGLAAGRPFWLTLAVTAVLLVAEFVFFLISPRLLLELPFKWRDLVPGAAVCTAAAIVVHVVTVFFLRNWVAEYGHAYGGFGVSLALIAAVGIIASFWVWIAAVMGVYWEHKAGPAAVTAMEELSAEISASEQPTVSKTAAS